MDQVISFLIAVLPSFHVSLFSIFILLAPHFLTIPIQFLILLIFLSSFVLLQFPSWRTLMVCVLDPISIFILFCSSFLFVYFLGYYYQIMYIFPIYCKFLFYFLCMCELSMRLCHGFAHLLPVTLDWNFVSKACVLILIFVSG